MCQVAGTPTQSMMLLPGSESGLDEKAKWTGRHALHDPLQFQAMSEQVVQIGDTVAVQCADSGPKLGTERDALDLIGEALSQGARLVIVPAERLDDAFFQLRTRVAGDFMQKLVNYRLMLAVVGDISAQLAESAALRDFVFESNRGKQIWFVADIPELEAKLRQVAGTGG
jgi:hypothetical protein